jgi:hypothetical protein
MAQDEIGRSIDWWHIRGLIQSGDCLRLANDFCFNIYLSTFSNLEIRDQLFSSRWHGWPQTNGDVFWWLLCESLPPLRCHFHRFHYHYEV